MSDIFGDDSDVLGESGQVETGEIADDSITTAKLADDAVTAAKLAGDAVVNELGYVESTTGILTTNTTATDATGMSVTVTVGLRPIIIEFGAPVTYNSTAGGTSYEIYDVTGSAIIAAGRTYSAVNLGYSNAYLRARRNPAPGSRTYKVRLYRVGGSQANFGAATAGDVTAWLQVTEV